MGIHHYQLEVVPQSFVAGIGSESIPMIMIQEGLTPWANLAPPSAQLIEKLRALLPLDKSWGEVEELVSGNEWGSDLRFWRTAGRIENIEFRYSPVGDGWQLMQQFLAAVRSEDCLLVERESGQVLQPNEETVKARIVASKACQFALDPKATLIRAARECAENSDGDSGRA